MNSLRLILILTLVLPIQLFAQEDTYHQELRAFLETTYGITGGNWVLSDTEQKINARARLTNVSRKTISYDGELPFSQILELKATSRKSNAWDNAVRFATSSDIKKNDALLLVVWMNSIESDEDINHITHVFELASSPYTKSLSLGGDIKPGWRQWLIPFKAEMDYDAGGARYQINMGHMAGTIQIAGLAILNFGTDFSVDDLPASTHHLDYAGREEGAAWRTEALQRIEQYRKGDLVVKVVNKDDQPIKNAQITATMQRHEFGFGTAISTRWWLHDLADSDTYLSKLEDLTGDGRSFNIVVFENATKWPAWENNSYLGTPDQVAEVVDWLKSSNMRVRGHNLVWPKWDHLPDDLQTHQNDPEYIKQRIRNHIAEEAGYEGLKGYIDEWDVINEMVHCTDLRDVFGTEDIYADWIKWAAEADSNALLFINEYSLINGGGNDLNSQQRFKEIIQNVLDLGAPLDGIGIQGHMGANFTPPEKVIMILNDFAKFGLDINITEYDASGADEAIAADYMRDILIAAFSVPQVKNFLMWGFWDGSHWHKDAPMFRQDWSIKPAGEAFIDWVFNKWWSNVSGATTRDGLFTARAFYGHYSIEAEFDGKTAAAQVDFSKDTGEIVLKIDSENTRVSRVHQVPLEFGLKPNYPNPFNPATTLYFTLPSTEQVKLQVYDATGRLVTTLSDGTMAAGEHSAVFHAANLPSGIYYARLVAGTRMAHQKMLLLR